MDTCKHLDTDKSCLIIKQLTGEEHLPSQEECRACSNCHGPQTINEITTSISNSILIEESRPTLYKISKTTSSKWIQMSDGPGTRLKKTISWFINTGTCDGCEERSKIMDTWHVEGCNKNIKTIVHWLDESAHLANMNISRSAIEMIVYILLKTPYKTPEKINTPEKLL